MAQAARLFSCFFNSSKQNMNSASKMISLRTGNRNKEKESVNGGGRSVSSIQTVDPLYTFPSPFYFSAIFKLHNHLEQNGLKKLHCHFPFCFLNFSDLGEVAFHPDLKCFGLLNYSSVTIFHQQGIVILRFYRYIIYKYAEKVSLRSLCNIVFGRH